MDAVSGFDKAELRQEALRRRAGVDPAVAAAFAERLADIGPQLCKAHGAEAASAFASMGEEVSTAPLMRALHAHGVAVALPVTGRLGTPLVFRRWTPDTRMVEGRMKIAEPPPDAPEIEPDLLFVPLVAFDRRGHRIGFGAGYYDRTLAGLRAKRDVVAIGIAFAAQETLFVPATEHDQPLDAIVTERDVILCADQA